MQIYLFSS